MGVKRPLDQEDFSELSFKQAKQHDNDIRLTFMTEVDFCSHRTTPEVDSPGEAKSNSRELHFDEILENGDTDGPHVPHRELEASAPLSLVNSDCTEEDTVNQDSSFSGFIDLSIPWRPSEWYYDSCASLLNISPRKEIPVGLEYQAEVPQWDPSSSKKDFLCSTTSVDGDGDCGLNLMGTCVIDMPALNDTGIHEVMVGHGRKDCSCLDLGSMRCVQQHVKEARERLRGSVGEETFMRLGFYDTGEEVACKWTAEDEQLFHEVVFSNPASRGGDLWWHLSAAFPSRSMKKLVSYYFNVFMLRRRAIQNRSYLFQIDSDNDEDPTFAPGNNCQNKINFAELETDSNDDDDPMQSHEGFQLVGGEGGGSGFKSLVDKDLDAGWVDNYGSVPTSTCRYEVNENNYGASANRNNYEQHALNMDGGCGQTSKQVDEK